jgi:hypothetical protein
MDVDAGGVTTALSYAFAIPDTATAADIIVMNFPYTVTGTDIATGNPFSYTYANSEVTITPVPGPGDFNGDLIVDGADFLFWQRDPNVGSLADWEANYGAPLSASSSAVPEPTTSALALAALCLAMSRRRIAAR